MPEAYLRALKKMGYRRMDGVTLSLLGLLSQLKIIQKAYQPEIGYIWLVTYDTIKLSRLGIFIAFCNLNANKNCKPYHGT